MRTYRRARYGRRRRRRRRGMGTITHNAIDLDIHDITKSIAYFKDKGFKLMGLRNNRRYLIAGLKSKRLFFSTGIIRDNTTLINPFKSFNLLRRNGKRNS